jgi:hypothetical protein
MLLAWVLGAPATLGELTLLPDPARVPFGRRLLMAGLIAGAAAFSYLVNWSGKRLTARFDARLAVRSRDEVVRVDLER